MNSKIFRQTLGVVAVFLLLAIIGCKSVDRHNELLTLQIRITDIEKDNFSYFRSDGIAEHWLVVVAIVESTGAFSNRQIKIAVPSRGSELYAYCTESVDVPTALRSKRIQLFTKISVPKSRFVLQVSRELLERALNSDAKVFFYPGMVKLDDIPTGPE